jgi:hypothetical protein
MSWRANLLAEMSVTVILLMCNPASERIVASLAGFGRPAVGQFVTTSQVDDKLYQTDCTFRSMELA